MKKIYALFVLAFITFSCSESDDFSSGALSRQPIKTVTRLDPTKLAKVVFYPGNGSEKNYYFYPNGLVRKITNGNGTLYQSFTYDAANNLIYTQRISNSAWVESYTYTFTYDANNHITAVNGLAVIYNATTNQYIFQYQPTTSDNPDCPTCYDYVDRTEITLNNDLLITNERTYYLSSDGNYSHGGMYAGYNNNSNMVFVSGWTDPSGPSYQYDNKINPLKAALLPLCRAMTVVRGMSYYERFATGENTSANNVIFNGYGDGDPESEEYIIEYNSNELPVKTTRKSYYFQTLELTQVSALYYYQGDVIP